MVNTKITEQPLSVWTSKSKNAHRNMCIARCTSLVGCVSVSVKLENETLTCGFFDKSPLSYNNSASYASNNLWTSFVPPPGEWKMRKRLNLI